MRLRLPFVRRSKYEAAAAEVERLRRYGENLKPLAFIGDEAWKDIAERRLAQIELLDLVGSIDKVVERLSSYAKDARCDSACR
jgi:alkanesulfonate monooxygenase SsuD/methylene tetrahydromethanopterin reductase-like flavin-dependent oxidoreductase (luciferase family)